MRQQNELYFEVVFGLSLLYVLETRSKIVNYIRKEREFKEVVAMWQREILMNWGWIEIES